jgi:uncharacterized membrane protein YwzB
MKNKQRLASKVLESIYLFFTLVGMMVVCWSVYSMALGTYVKTCETIQKKLLMR